MALQLKLAHLSVGKLTSWPTTSREDALKIVDTTMKENLIVDKFFLMVSDLLVVYYSFTSIGN